MPRRPGDVGLKLRTAISHSLEELDRVAGAQPHPGLLPRRLLPDVAADPARLAAHAQRAHVLDLHVEERLHRALDLVLVRLGVHRERHDVVALALDRALLGDHRAPDHLPQVLHDSLSLSAGSASRSTISALRSSTSRTFSPTTGSTRTVGRLRPASSSTRSRSRVRISASSAPSSR